jgi:putative oxidoreductase
MQDAMQDRTALVGRILLGTLFIVSGLGKIGGFEGTAGYIASKGLPMAHVVAALTIAIEVGGGLLLAFGLFTRQAAFGLAAFTLLAGLIFHDFWAVPAAQFQGQFVHFMKNVSISGGMLVLAAFGPGALSLDARRGARPAHQAALARA